MYVLGGWAALNIAGGLALRSTTTGEARRFHEMNATWNVVNLGIAGIGYYGVTRQADPSAVALAPAVAQYYTFQKTLLFNAGLDIGYVATGFYLRERARRPDNDTDRLRGYGNALLLQGGFLFAFDLANHFISASRQEDLNLILGATQDGLGMIYTF